MVGLLACSPWVVYDYAKILNLKQFTTSFMMINLHIQLSMTMQRY